MARVHITDQVPGAKKQILDKHPLFNKFDPENTLLNCPKKSAKSYQHSREYKNDGGCQLRDEIRYEDQVSLNQFAFSQLEPTPLTST